MKKSKIICLHGGRSSGVLLKEELEIWPSSVLERMDLVCIDAPFAAYDVDFRAFTWYDDNAKLRSWSFLRRGWWFCGVAAGRAPTKQHRRGVLAPRRLRRENKSRLWKD